MSTDTKNFIAGKWVAAASTFDSVNPATGELVSRCTQASQQELDAAVAAASEAFPAWRKTPPPRRAEILFRVAELLAARKDDLARWITIEMGKVMMEARGDVQEAIDMARYMAGEGRRMFGHTTPSELPDKFCMSVRDPIGVVAVITPWNFPIAVPSWKILPALVLGNTVVWKPSSDTPACAARFVDAFVEAGLPPGVLNLVLGRGAEIGDALVLHRDVRLVTFTGSNEVGRRVSVTAAETGKRCALEMGGKNGIIVLDDADLALAVDGVVWSAFGTSGQRCTAASRIIVHRSVREPLTQLLLDRVKQLEIGNGLDPSTTVGPVINQAALERIEGYVHIGLDEGARLLTGGERFSKGECRRGWFYRPTVFDNVTPAMRIAREEIFGPFVCIIEAGSLEEAVAINNDTSYGLVSSIYTRSIDRAFTAMRELATGIVYVNAGTIGSEVQLPFGGTRGTGNGAREAGQAALDTFSEWKTLYVDYSGRLQRAQIDSEAPTHKKKLQNENSRTQISPVRPGTGKAAARIRGGLPRRQRRRAYPRRNVAQDGYRHQAAHGSSHLPHSQH
jgi:alpha-ketoglutaric semialdehyde dehydrogenase